MHRPLRITVSILSGICCVLVIVLWVRSYRGCDVFYWAPSTKFAAYSVSGSIGVSIKRNSPAKPTWNWSTITIMPSLGPVREWTHRFDRNGASLRFPHRLLFAAFVGTVVAPWLSWRSYRFSLRAMLLATTAAAVFLGLIIYAMRG